MDDGLPQLFAHPFSAYCWKVLIALWETATPFDYRSVVEPANAAEWQRLAPLGKMPLLIDRAHVIPESTIIVEHLALTRAAARRLIPIDRQEAMETRLLDRLADQYLLDPATAIVADRLRSPADRSAAAVAASRAMLDRAYGWWNGHMATREWAAGDFGLADCAAAPALFYADWVHPIPDEHAALRAYRARLLARPSVARAVDEARPFRGHFPGGAPDRD